MSPWYASRPLITFGKSSARHSRPRFRTITSLVEILRAILFPLFATELDYSWVPHWSSFTIRTQLQNSGTPSRLHVRPKCLRSYLNYCLFCLGCRLVFISECIGKAKSPSMFKTDIGSADVPDL